jgi:large subunit ribosomal protein L4
MATTTAKMFASDGTEKGAADLPDELFGQEVKEHLLWLSVKRHLGNQRQGNAKVKARGEVSGGGRKPWRQKGTGRARSGSNTSPLWPGGGRAFGPKPRDYRTELPKRQRRAALACALSLKANESAVSVVENIAIAAPKTAEISGLLKRLGLQEKRTLLVLGDHDENVFKSCRNIRNLTATLAHQLNPYQLLNCDQVLMTAGGLERVKEVFVR